MSTRFRSEGSDGSQAISRKWGEFSRPTPPLFLPGCSTRSCRTERSAVSVLLDRHDHTDLPERLQALREAWEAWQTTVPPIPEDATVSLGYSYKDMPQR